jgi:preprotein translocase subunit SecA
MELAVVTLSLLHRPWGSFFTLMPPTTDTGLLRSIRVPMESALVTQALDRAQAEAEEQHRGARRLVFRLDEVAAYQRSVVYSQRRAYLTSSDEGTVSAPTVVVVCTHMTYVSFTQHVRVVLIRVLAVRSGHSG